MLRKARVKRRSVRVRTPHVPRPPGGATSFCKATEATDAPASHERQDELEPLSHEELSQTYGLGFTLLQRMGYALGAPLKPGALQAPLLARGNRGRQGLTQEASEGLEALEPEAVEAEPEDLTALLAKALQSMREAGDVEEAEELQQLATFCQGGLSGLPHAQTPKKRKRRSEKLEGDEDAIAEVLKHFEDPEFPVEVQQQETSLKWRKRWGRLGSYWDFVQRHTTHFRVIPCPTGLKMILPQQRREQFRAFLQSCEKWCSYQSSKGGRGLKRKWRHLAQVLRRLQNFAT